ncbi:YceH family protein [Chitinibacter bivalviorum]|uniref:YceH family protein n=1 Tax=Chitinibacter bivalviorum TaxID=2739434 RepID=A0A7H9BHD0_9NEIS|nr:YceH family protein [Chitinibacter bivalviorum]QLG87361.1 YceH family protein [Chitinibacter bivalviorum]
MDMGQLDAVQIRVLGVLIEKERTVPDTYPLSINGLLAGCNQKSSREPVMELTEGDIIAAIDALKQNGWVIDHLSARVAKYSHQFGKVLQIPSQSVAALAVLMLRGPQTAGELRNNCERLHRFADISAIEAFLQELAERPSGALVKLLPRQPGSREPRWAHLLAGDVELPIASHLPSSENQLGLLTRIEELEAQLAELKSEFVALKTQLGA